MRFQKLRCQFIKHVWQNKTFEPSWWNRAKLRRNVPYGYRAMTETIFAGKWDENGQFNGTKND